MKTKYIIITSLVSLIFSSCNKNDSSIGESEDKKFIQNNSLPKKEKYREPDIQQIKFLEKEIDELMKDITYNNSSAVYSNFKGYSDFFYNKEFRRCITKLVSESGSDYKNSPSKLIRKEYARVSRQLSQPSNLLDFYPRLVSDYTSVSNDRKGSGRLFKIIWTTKTFIPLKFNYKYSIYSDVKKQKSNDRGKKNYDSKWISDKLTTGSELSSASINIGFDYVYDTYKKDYITIWDKARGEKVSGREYSKMVSRKYDYDDTFDRSVGIWQTTWWRYTKVRWGIGGIKVSKVSIDD